MNVPAFIEAPIGEIVGNQVVLSEPWKKLFQQLLQNMQLNLSDEGLKAPLQSAASIALLNTSLSTSNILYDSDNDLFKGNVAGTYKTFVLV